MTVGCLVGQKAATLFRVPSYRVANERYEHESCQDNCSYGADVIPRTRRGSGVRTAPRASCPKFLPGLPSVPFPQASCLSGAVDGMSNLTIRVSNLGPPLSNLTIRVSHLATCPSYLGRQQSSSASGHAPNPQIASSVLHHANGLAAGDPKNGAAVPLRLAEPEPDRRSSSSDQL
jgi:hypothetical protein